MLLDLGKCLFDTDRALGQEGCGDGGVEGGPVGEDGGVEELVTLRVHPAKGDEHAGSLW